MYKVMDYFTNAIVIETDNKSEVNIAIDEWMRNNPDSCIEIFKDGVSIYP